MSPLLALLFGAPVAVTSAPAASATPVPAPKHLVATRVTSPPTIDGKLDEPAWRSAPASDGFTQKVPNDGAAPTDPTTVRVLYDDDAIYIGIDCPQPHTPVTPRLTRRDRVVETDSITVDLGTRGDHKSAFEFYVNASGTLADAIRFNDTEYSADWDENWEARTSIGESGWSAEFRIPLRVLRFPSLPVQSWDFQATRYISARQETDTWAYFPRRMAGEVSRYGRLDIPEALDSKSPIEVRPYIAGRVRRRDPAPGQLANGTDVRGFVGGDARWHLTPELTLDATINPDFAQVEADQLVLNLSTIETYYPEKRAFFLEGLGAFKTPFELFYSRRIGRAPPIPSLRTDAVNQEQLVDVPEASTIYGATKLTGALGQKWSVGTVQAVTAPNSVQVQLGDGSRVKRTLEPLSSFNVVRVKRDIGDNADVAAMFTAVTHAESTRDYPRVLPDAMTPGAQTLCPARPTSSVHTPLQVAPSGRCFNDAYVGAIDWRWRSGEYATGGQVASSVLENGPARKVADGTTVRPGELGWGTQAYVSKEGGKHWLGDARADIESRKFDINDLGFNSRANLIKGYGRIEYRELEPTGPFRETHQFLSLRSSHNQSGLSLGQTAYFVSFGRFNNLWDYAIDVHYLSTKFDDREVGDGTALQRAARFGNEVMLSTDTTRRLALSVDQVTEIVGGGFNMSGNATLTVRVLPQFDVDLLPTWEWTRGEPRFAEGGAAVGQYLFGRLEAKSIGLTMRTTYTFTPRVTLQGYAQLFLASGHYSQFTEYRSDPSGPPAVARLADLATYTGAVPSNPDFQQTVLNVNVVFRWEYVLGSTLFVVYTRSQVPTTVLGATDVGTLSVAAVAKAPASDAVLVKVTYWWGG